MHAWMREARGIGPFAYPLASVEFPAWSGTGDYNPKNSLIGRLAEAINFDRALSAKEAKAIYRAQR